MNEPRRDLLPDAALARDEDFRVRSRRIVHLDLDLANGRAYADELCCRLGHQPVDYATDVPHSR
jgi:hypothetical protein